MAVEAPERIEHDGGAFTGGFRHLTCCWRGCPYMLCGYDSRLPRSPGDGPRPHCPVCYERGIESVTYECCPYHAQGGTTP